MDPLSSNALSWRDFSGIRLRESSTSVRSQQLPIEFQCGCVFTQTWQILWKLKPIPTPTPLNTNPFILICYNTSSKGLWKEQTFMGDVMKIWNLETSQPVNSGWLFSYWTKIKYWNTVFVCIHAHARITVHRSFSAEWMHSWLGVFHVIFAF